MRRVHAELTLGHGISVGRQAVEGLIRDDGTERDLHKAALAATRSALSHYGIDALADPRPEDVIRLMKPTVLIGATAQAGAFTRAMLEAMVESRQAESINLRNRISIEIHTASYRATRGYTIVAAICDEIAFWRSDESANPDSEVLAALRPGMATVPGALLLGVSSPYARRGVLWDAYRRYWAKDDAEVLIWQGATVDMNPSVDLRVIERAYQEDEVAARAEYGAQFRSDIEAFLSREVLDAVVVPGRADLPPVEGTRYQAFCDPSGGSADSMTLAIAHKEDDRAVIDCVRERRPPFSPDDVVQEFAGVLERYHVREIRGDRDGAEWVREAFAKAGVQYRPAEKPKSDLYRELVAPVNAQRVELLEHAKALAQLASLERRTARGGRDSIDHPPGAHDDVANVIAGAVYEVIGCRRGVTWEDL
jgi:hypothetical protein